MLPDKPVPVENLNESHYNFRLKLFNEHRKSPRDPQTSIRLRFVSDESGGGDRGCFGWAGLCCADADGRREVAVLSDTGFDAGRIDAGDLAADRVDEGSG